MEREFHAIFTARFPPSRAGASNYSVEQAEIVIKLQFFRLLKLSKSLKILKMVKISNFRRTKLRYKRFVNKIFHFLKLFR